MKLSELPKKYRILAEVRIQQLHKKYLSKGGKFYPDSVCNFMWTATPEGFEFWSAVDEVEDMNHLPPIPPSSEIVKILPLTIKHIL